MCMHSSFPTSTVPHLVLSFGLCTGPEPCASWWWSQELLQRQRCKCVWSYWAGGCLQFGSSFWRNFHPCHLLSWSKSHKLEYLHHAMLVGWGCTYGLNNIMCVRARMCVHVCVCVYVYCCLFTCCRNQEAGKLCLWAPGCKWMVLLGFPPLPTSKGMSMALLHPLDCQWLCSVHVCVASSHWQCWYSILQAICR